MVDRFALRFQTMVCSAGNRTLHVFGILGAKGKVGRCERFFLSVLCTYTGTLFDRARVIAFRTDSGNYVPSTDIFYHDYRNNLFGGMADVQDLSKGTYTIYRGAIN